MCLTLSYLVVRQSKSNTHKCVKPKAAVVQIFVVDRGCLFAVMKTINIYFTFIKVLFHFVVAEQAACWPLYQTYANRLDYSRLILFTILYNTTSTRECTNRPLYYGLS